MAKPIATMMRKVQKIIADRRALVLGKGIQPLNRRIEAVGQDQRAQQRYLHLVAGHARLVVGQAEQDQRRAAFGEAFVMALHRGDLGGLVLQRVQAVHVAGDDLDRRDDQRHPHRHREHHRRAAALRGRAADASAPTPPTTKAVVR